MAQVAAVTLDFVLKVLETRARLDRKELLEAIDLDESVFTEENAKVDGAKLGQLFAIAMEKTGDPHLALHLGESTSPQSLGLLGYLLINAATVGEMLEKLSRYHKLIGRQLEFAVSQTGTRYRMAVSIAGNPLIPMPRFQADVHLSAILSLLRQVSGNHIFPSQVHFQREAPENADEYRRIFGERVRFSRQENALFFSKEALDIPLKFSNPGMLQFFQAQAQKVLEEQADASWRARVRREILLRLSDGAVSVETVAEALEVSPRTLQNRLKAEKATFREALESVRKQMARHYLDQTNLDLATIALYLGYAEAPVFIRAFRKWTGLSPGEYREKKL